MKLAAMEALYEGGNEQALTMVAWVNPLEQPDYTNEDEPALKIAMPYALSFMATNDFDGYVPGINDLLNGYTRPDGTREPSADEKIARGKMAIAALQAYRQAKAEGDERRGPAAVCRRFRENVKYFGYGYMKDKRSWCRQCPSTSGPSASWWDWAACSSCSSHWWHPCWFKVPSSRCRRLLAALGLMDEAHADVHGATHMPRWLLIAAIVMVPLAYIASESGWLVAEFGRQPWTIQDMLPTWAAVSDLQPGSVMLTFFLFLILFTTMLAVEINIMLKQIKKGRRRRIMTNDAQKESRRTRYELNDISIR